MYWPLEKHGKRHDVCIHYWPKKVLCISWSFGKNPKLRISYYFCEKDPDGALWVKRWNHLNFLGHPPRQEVLALGVNIDKKIDNFQCPEPCLCTVATTCYSEVEREHKCYRCWLTYCRTHNIEIIYE